jgi:hypothetical protein
MTKKDILSQYIKFRFEGYIVDKSQEVISSATFGFEFRNLGTLSVFVNGIELPPAPSKDNVFIETFLDRERSYGQYNVVFAQGVGTKKLLVIEKYGVTDEKD